MMQKMSEFVENRFGFAVRQQGGLAIDGRRQIAANKTEMRSLFFSEDRR